MEIHNEAFVYKWINLITGAFYVGYHKGSQDDGYICSSKSDKFWDDFRNPNFAWKREILFEGNTADCVKEEYKILNELNLHDEFVYNNSKGGGIVFNDEVRKKMAKRKLGKKRPPITEETRKRMSDAKMGKTYSLEARANMSAGMKGRIPWNTGKTFSVETRVKMSKKKLGIKWSEESIQKRAAANKGKTRLIVSCPFCKKEGGRPAMLRWHFENCKEYNKENL